jgi:hypothetical protein
MFLKRGCSYFQKLKSNFIKNQILLIKSDVFKNIDFHISEN